MTPYVGTFPDDALVPPISDAPQVGSAGLGQELFAAETGGDHSLHALDVIQAGLGLVGMADFLPPLAIAADSLNTAISSWRGDTTGAALGVASMVPGLGIGAGITNIARHFKPVQVIYSKQAEKDLAKVDKRIVAKFYKWLAAVRERGLDEVGQIPGVSGHSIDFGKHQGSESVRLNRNYRAFYTRMDDGILKVETITNHDYKLK